jgi:hypothetical protein
MRRVVDASQSFWGLVSATVVLAAGVSLVEFSCTAGFPVIWTNLLTSQSVTTSQFIFLLILYMLFYQLDEMVIFFLGSSNIEGDSYGGKERSNFKVNGRYANVNPLCRYVS